jgi:hypothetical protein
MADRDQLAILRRGPAAWNAWRREHPEFEPDLSEASLGGAQLLETGLQLETILPAVSPGDAD